MVKGKAPMVRKKIEIKRIKNEDARLTCFSKRRQGLFKKASELSILCGATVGCVVFSNKGRPFSFGHPSIHEVADRFNDSVATGGIAMGGANHDNSGAVTDTVHRLNLECRELQESLESENKKKERLQEAIEKEMDKPVMQWLKSDVSELGLVDLQEFLKCLEEVDAAVKEKTNQILVEARQVTRGLVPQPPMETASTSRYQFGQHISARSMASIPSSSNGFTDGFQVCDPLRNGGLEDVCGLGNFPNNQNHG